MSDVTDRSWLRSALKAYDKQQITGPELANMIRARLSPSVLDEPVQDEPPEDIPGWMAEEEGGTFYRKEEADRWMAEAQRLSPSEGPFDVPDDYDGGPFTDQWQADEVDK